MRNALIALFVVALLAGCATAGQGVGIHTNPKMYLSEFPLGMEQEKLLRDLGAPDNEITVNGRKAWVYTLGEGYGKRRYTYVFDDGRVHDVLYNDQGPWNGMTARGRQGES